VLWQLASYPYPKARSNSRFLEGTFVFMPVSGFYHWLIEDLPVFLRSIESAPDARVLVPSRAPEYVWSALNWLGHDDAIEIDKRVSVEKLDITAKSDGSGTVGANVHPVDVGLLRQRFRSLIPTSPVGHRLVSIRTGYKRSVEDEHDLVRRLSPRGFEGVDPSTLSFPEQITLFANTEHLVGLHGAGLTNSIWMSEGAKVTEIFSSRYMVPCFATLAAVRGLKYSHYVYPPDSKVLGKQVIEEVVSGIDL
jgi:capsular polysaccharide biosynthesis protein